jgi:hypothetical protein
MHARPLRIQQRSTTAAALVFLNDTLHVAQILPSSQYWTVAPLANHALLPQSVCVRAHLDRNICACWLAAARCPPRDTKGTVEPTCDLHVLDLAKGGLLRQPSCASTRPCWTCPPPPASTADNWESSGQINVDAPVTTLFTVSRFAGEPCCGSPLAPSSTLARSLCLERHPWHIDFCISTLVIEKIKARRHRLKYRQARTALSTPPVAGIVNKLKNIRGPPVRF